MATNTFVGKELFNTSKLAQIPSWFMYHQYQFNLYFHANAEPREAAKIS